MSGKKKIRFIINPISGIGKKNQLPDLIEKHLDHRIFDYEIRLSEYKLHARLIAQESVLEGFDIVCAVGGDGSVHEVGTGLIDSNVKLAIIPAGSGNGLARHLQIPLEVIAAIESINGYYLSKMDTVLCNDTPFLGFGGFGFDAMIAKKFDEYHKRGLSSYVKLVFQEIFGYKREMISVKIDDKEWKGKFILCSIANSSEFGNGFCISPHSNIEDNQLEICLVEKLPIFGAPKLLLDVFFRRVDKNKHITIVPFQEAIIKLDRPIAHFDGEPFVVDSKVKIKIKPKSLNILVGKKYYEVG